MTFSQIQSIVDNIGKNEKFLVSLKLRDKLFRNGMGMPLTRARKIASLVKVGSPEDDFLEEVAGLLHKLSDTIVPELGEEALFMAVENMSTIYKD